MTAIKSWLLSVVACSFLGALAQSLPLKRTGKRALTLLCGCLLVLTVLRPLLRLKDLSPADLLLPWETADPEAVARAESENEALLQELIRSQTEDLLAQKAEAVGAALTFRVELRRDEAAGVWVPWAVEASGRADAAQQAALSDWLQDALSIPPERQRWVEP